MSPLFLDIFLSLLITLLSPVLWLLLWFSCFLCSRDSSVLPASFLPSFPISCFLSSLLLLLDPYCFFAFFPVTPFSCFTFLLISQSCWAFLPRSPDLPFLSAYPSSSITFFTRWSFFPFRVRLFLAFILGDLPTSSLVISFSLPLWLPFPS